MNKHPDCANECQQAVDYGVWPERSCSPKCARLSPLFRAYEDEPGCTLCRNPMFVGIKCNNCGAVSPNTQGIGDNMAEQRIALHSGTRTPAFALPEVRPYLGEKMEDGYTVEKLKALIHDRMAAMHLTGLDRMGFPQTSVTFVQHYVDKVIEAAILAERERSAGMCERQAERWTDDRARYVAHECAAAIRKG
jgi:hypothetical protein